MRPAEFILVSPRLVGDRGLARRIVLLRDVHSHADWRRHNLNCAARSLASARRQLLQAEYVQRQRGTRWRERYAERMHSAMLWLCVAAQERRAARSLESSRYFLGVVTEGP